MSRFIRENRLGRRRILQMASAGTVGAVARAALGGEPAAESPPPPMSSMARYFAYGYNREPYPLPPGPHLFIDWRYVQCGAVAWLKPDGSGAPLFAHQEIPDVRGEPYRVPWGIRLAAGQAERIGPVLSNDRDWEFMIGGYATLLDLGGRFGLWYEAVPPGGDGEANLLCYAESTDGLNWTKPELGLCEYDGRTKNNIVIDGRRCPYGSFHGNGVFLDPTAPPQERFKVVYMAMLKDDGPIARLKRERPWSVSPFGEAKRSIIQYAVSPDGLHWTFNDGAMLSHMSDTQTVVYYDGFLRRYVGYFRTLVMNRRGIGRAETPDLGRWPVPETLLWSDAGNDPAEDCYTNSKSLYPGTQTMHLMFPTIYKRRVDGCSLRMASSLDGAAWQWIPGGDVLTTGAEGTWDAGCFFAGSGLTEIPGDRVVLPYGGYHRPHKYPRWGRMGQIGLACWKKERLAALVADEQGEFCTQQLLLPGDTLHLNFQTSQAGYIRVAVEDVEGRRLDDCDPLIGDRVKAPVTWRGESSLKVGTGTPVVLRFRMRAARLYSFEIR